MLEDMGAASIINFDALWCWNTLERRPWEITERLATSSSNTKEYPCFKKVLALACLKKKERKK